MEAITIASMHTPGVEGAESSHLNEDSPMPRVAVKAELISSIFSLVQTEADMPRTKAALSDALRVGAEEMTSQITNGMIAPAAEAAPARKRANKSGNGKKAHVEK